MKAKHLCLPIALLAASGLWLGPLAWRTHEFHESNMRVGFKRPRATAGLPSEVLLTKEGPASGPNNRARTGHMLNSAPRLAPPDPNRRFTEFTPEQRVQFARQGHGPGG